MESHCFYAAADVLQQFSSPPLSSPLLKFAAHGENRGSDPALLGSWKIKQEESGFAQTSPIGSTMDMSSGLKGRHEKVTFLVLYLQLWSSPMVSGVSLHINTFPVESKC